jgi:hypothetical protein
MKQYIILMLCLMISSMLQGQSYCNPNGITTNPDAPINTHNPNFKNTFFDWRVDLNAIIPITSYEHYFNPNYTVSAHPASFPYSYSPYWGPFNYLGMITGYYDGEEVIDYYPEDGWELITRGMGKYKNGNNYVGFYCPYFLMYNKYQGKFRIFFALPSIDVGGQTDKIEVLMTFNDENAANDLIAPVTGLFGHNGPTSQPLDKATSVTQVSGIAKYNPSGWNFTDIIVAYDPCTCNGETSIQVDFKTVEEGEVTLTGGALGIESTLGQNTNFFNNNMLLNIINNGITEAVGVQTYNSLADGLSNYNAGDNGIRTSVEILTQIANAFGYITPTLASHAPFTSDATKAAEQKQYKEDLDFMSRTLKYGTSLLKKLEEKKTLPTIIQSEIALTGGVTSSSTNTTASFVIDNPGTSSSSNTLEFGVSNHPSYPFYNEVLGRVALLKTPEIKSSGTIYKNGWKSSTYRKYQFDESSLEYVYNPAVNVNEAKTTILAALVFESSTNTAEFIYNDKYDNFFPQGYSLYENGVFLNQSIKDGIATYIDKEIYRTPYLPLECLGNYTVTFMTDTSGVNSENISFQYTRPVTPYLQLMIFYEFDELDREGNPNKDIQILTYPLDKVGTPIEEYSAALPFEKTISTTNYTQNEVIEAMGVVIISGNLSANQGVEVDIIANSIVVLDGVEIGQGINLISGTPNVCGAKIPKSTMNLTTYCEGSNYKGDNRKNLEVIEPTPKPKKESKFSMIAYPNPFETSTTVEFTLPKEENVTLRLFNALGVEVESMMEQETLSAGTYKRVTRSDLSSGIYFAILQTTNGTQTIKIIKQ